MDNKLIIGMGAAIVALGAGEVYFIVKANKMSKQIREFNDSVDETAENIKVDIPDKLVAVAMDRAANREAERASKKVSSDANAIIQTSVDKAISKEKSNIEKSVKAELEKKINLVDIEDIKTKVVSQASSTVAANVMSKIPSMFTKGSDIADIIRACKEAGLSSWTTEEIVKNARG